jgi:hypothetical protein
VLNKSVNALSRQMGIRMGCIHQQWLRAFALKRYTETATITYAEWSYLSPIPNPSLILRECLLARPAPPCGTGMLDTVRRVG